MALGQVIELGLIDGNFFNSDHVNIIEAAINSSSHAGDVKMSIASAAEPGWLMLAGQIVDNAQALYPSLWAVAPPAWKVGAALQLPNMATHFPMGGSVGAIGGGNTKQIVAANLPPHQHANDHDHGAVLTEGRNRAHTHTPTMGPENAQHAHEQYVTSDVAGGPGTRVDFVRDAPGGGAGVYPQGIVTGGEIGTHAHDLTLSTETADHEHNLNMPNYVGSTGNGPGTSVALDVTPAYVTFNFMVRAF